MHEAQRKANIRWNRPRTLTQDDVDQFVEASRNQTPQVFSEIEALLSKLPDHSLRVNSIRRDMRWLQKQLKKKGLT